MKNQIRPLLLSFLILGLLTGVVYPLLVTGLAQLIFPVKANGSLIKVADKSIGSELIGQSFSSDAYFWSRPSATSPVPYTAFNQTSLTGSAGSNLGPLSQELVNEVKDRVSKLQQANPESKLLIPIDLITSSASGLDPDISVSAAYYQAPRVARVRKMAISEVNSIIESNIERPQFGFLGEARVNVLKLNMALDGIQYKK